MSLDKLRENLNPAINFWLLQEKEKYLQSLENGFDINYATNYFACEKNQKKYRIH